VISHNLHPQCCLLTERLSEHRPESVYNGLIVANPSRAVDDQQDSFNYGHRMLFRFTKSLLLGLDELRSVWVRERTS
jgi:hypothetical protein